MRTIKKALLSAAVCLISISFASARPLADDELLLSGPIERAALERMLRAGDGRVLIHAPELGIALVRAPRWSQASLRRHPKLTAFDAEILESVPVADAAPELAALARVFSSVPDKSTPFELGEFPPDDALVAADWWESDAPARAKSGALRPYGADWRNTSEFLAGRVSVNLLLLESDGSVDPDRENWTASLETQIVAETLEGLTDLIDMYPGSELSFVLHVIGGRTDARAQTGYEPISRPADPSGTGGEELWTLEVFEKLGYSTGSRLTRSRLYADDTRVADGSDWATSLFVVNSAADGDGKFADGRFAYAWLGGPHIVMTTDNDGWGTTRFNSVLRHELHHTFFTLDQYAASGCRCDSVAGYLAGVNANCENGCGALETDVMRNNAKAATVYTRTQVGSVDSDFDGTPDLLSVPPSLTIELRSDDPSCDGLAVLGGTATVGRATNLNPGYVTPRLDISVLEIAEVELRIDDEEWQRGLVTADDGAFDEAVEPFGVGVSLPTGRHRIEVRALDARGNTSASATRSVDVAESATPVGPTLRIDLEPGGLVLRWDAAPGAQTYRVLRSSQPSGLDDADSTVELAATSWTDSAPGTLFYRIVAVDGCGREAP